MCEFRLAWRGRPFLVMEYLAGGTLADRLRRESIPAADAISLTAVLADALAAMHDSGYLHRDIKPSNIGFTSDGSPKLLDFGLAREPNDDVVAGGTLRYLSPEILSGRPMKGTTPGRCAWFCTRWYRACIRSPAGASTRWRR